MHQLVVAVLACLREQPVASVRVLEEQWPRAVNTPLDLGQPSRHMGKVLEEARLVDVGETVHLQEVTCTRIQGCQSLNGVFNFSI